jgi:hypothetical protein
MWRFIAVLPMVATSPVIFVDSLAQLLALSASNPKQERTNLPQDSPRQATRVLDKLLTS